MRNWRQALQCAKMMVIMVRCRMAGDVLIVFTTSGNSQNIVRALEEAKKLGVFSIAFLGKGGGKCKDLSDLEVLVPGTKTTARIQEVHHFLLHVICEGIEPYLKK